MKRVTVPLLLCAVCAIKVSGATATLVGWNNLGMHCMDSDYSVFSILPPYNTVEAQLVVGGKLVKDGSGYSVTYEAVADPVGSFNSTSAGKTDFFQYSGVLYGKQLVPENGLLQWAMPGPGNTPVAMLFEQTNTPAPGASTAVYWFRAEGIPITPYDDALRKNPYPMMQLVARDTQNQTVAGTRVVLPVSDEMDCRACHASGTGAAAEPAAGWVWDGLPERDYRLNILRLHDEKSFAGNATLYAAALAARGFNAAGLYRGVVADGKPVLCAACHASEALGAPSYGPIRPLTASVHGFHASVKDPDTQVSLNDAGNRSACYRCHPGSTTRCLRGAMGGAIAGDGSLEMQCQSCHGSMSQVGSTNRVGWFMEPVCQSCHTGTATHNNGLIRYTSAFTDAQGSVRVAVDQTFATSANTPAQGLSLYRFSAGHGGLQCSACHGSTHAEFPSTHANDNVQSIALQGHTGVMVECTACHVTMPGTANGGPHGLHTIGQSWVSGEGGVARHPDYVESNGSAACQACHGSDYRGTVLSRAQADRSFGVFGTTLSFSKGAIIGCYSCHNGPGSENMNTTAAPTVSNFTTNTANDQALKVALKVSGAGATARILSQPAHGSVGVSNNVATFVPEPGYAGTVSFQYSAFNGSKNASPATATINVSQGGASITAKALVSPQYPATWPAPFGAVASPVNLQTPATYSWDFGDGSSGSGQYVSHAYVTPGQYQWTVVSAAGGVSVTNSGTIDVMAPLRLSVENSGSPRVTWAKSTADAVLEQSSSIAGNENWVAVGTLPVEQNGVWTVALPAAGNASQFFRLRRAW